jgi:hypothetical protein
MSLVVKEKVRYLEDPFAYPGSVIAMDSYT